MGEMRRVWKNPGFWFSVFLGIFSMLYPHTDTHIFWQTPLDYFACGDFLYYMLMPLDMGLAKLLLPIIAVFPAAAFLAEDQRQRQHLLLCYRYGRWGYLRHRMSMAAGTAILAAALGFLAYAVFAALACPWHDHIVSSWRDLDHHPFNWWVNSYEGMPFLLFNLLCLCVSSAVWALIGFSISCFTTNTGAVVGGTFLLHYMASWLCSRVLKQSEWSPMVLQAPDTHYQGSIWMILVRLFVWLGLALALAIGSGSLFLARLRED